MALKLELRKITKSFGFKTVLRDISLMAYTGYCVGVLGRNGAGKSTLFNIITNGLAPSSGEILLDGVKLSDSFDTSVMRRLGVLVNDAHLVDQLTAAEYLQFVARIYKLPDALVRIDSLLAYLLEEYSAIKNKRLGSFSTGMKQKVAIASCLLHRPELLVLDEPFNGLDVFSAERVLALLRQYLPQTLLFVSSHNLAHIEKIATHLLILDENEIKFWGSLDEFLKGQHALLGEALHQLLIPAASEAQDITWLTTPR